MSRIERATNHHRIFNIKRNIMPPELVWTGQKHKIFYFKWKKSFNNNMNMYNT